MEIQLPSVVGSMKPYLGVAVMPDQPPRKVNVVVEMLAGYIVIRDSAGKRLRSWPAHEIEAKTREGSHLLLTMGEDEIPFETEDPMGFIKSLEAES